MRSQWSNGMFHLCQLFHSQNKNDPNKDTSQAVLCGWRITWKLENVRLCSKNHIGRWSFGWHKGWRGLSWKFPPKDFRRKAASKICKDSTSRREGFFGQTSATQQFTKFQVSSSCDGGVLDIFGPNRNRPQLWDWYSNRRLACSKAQGPKTSGVKKFHLSNGCSYSYIGCFYLLDLAFVRFFEVVYALETSFPLKMSSCLWICILYHVRRLVWVETMEIAHESQCKTMLRIHNTSCSGLEGNVAIVPVCQCAVVPVYRISPRLL